MLRDELCRRGRGRVGSVGTSSSRAFKFGIDNQNVSG